MDRTIKIVITKQDRKSAGEFKDFKNCILATLLKRRGFDVSSACIRTVFVNAGPNNHVTFIADIDSQNLYSWWPWSMGKKVKRSAVGKKITFTEV